MLYENRLFFNSCVNVSRKFLGSWTAEENKECTEPLHKFIMSTNKKALKHFKSVWGQQSDLFMGKCIFIVETTRSHIFCYINDLMHTCQISPKYYRWHTWEIFGKIKKFLQEGIFPKRGFTRFNGSDVSTGQKTERKEKRKWLS